MQFYFLNDAEVDEQIRKRRYAKGTRLRRGWLGDRIPKAPAAPGLVVEAMPSLPIVRTLEPSAPTASPAATAERIAGGMVKPKRQLQPLPEARPIPQMVVDDEQSAAPPQAMTEAPAQTAGFDLGVLQQSFFGVPAWLLLAAAAGGAFWFWSAKKKKRKAA